MDDSFGGDLNSTQTAIGSGGAESEKKGEGIVPVFIKQLHESSNTSFTMYGMNFGMICCTAIVRSIDHFSTKITYLFEDHTGRIEGHYWLEDGDDDADTISPDILINNYAKVFGCMRSQGGTKTLMIFRLFNIKDPNEISTHILEVLNARFKAEEYSNESSAYFGNNTNSIGGVCDMPLDTGIASSLDSKQRMIYETVRSCNESEGISRKDLLKKFAKFSEHEINTILEFLSSEGHIYTSFDSDHFLSTE